MGARDAADLIAQAAIDHGSFQEHLELAGLEGCT
jgi:hypothetical protein